MRSFSSQNRLILKNDFQSVFKASNKIYSQSFLIFYRCNELLNSRLGILVRKSILNLAVDRNRVKRLIRESFRHSNIKHAGLDIVILLKTNFHFHDTKLLREEVNKLWNRLANFSNKP